MIKTTHTNYPVGDFLIRIKNAGMANLTDLSLPSTKLIHALAKTLKKEGFLSDVELSKDNILTVKIAKTHKEPVIIDLRIVSKPGLRIYKSVDDIKAKKTASSILILSTPSGIMSGKDAIKNNVGGEVLAEVW